LPGSRQAKTFSSLTTNDLICSQRVFLHISLILPAKLLPFVFPANTFTDKELLERLAVGEETVFSYLFERYRDPIYSTALHLSGSASMAEEIVQDVFLDLWLKRQNAATITYLPAYLNRMAANKLYDALKQRQRQRGIEQTTDAEADLHTPAILLENKDYDAILTRAITRLPEKQRLAYQLIKQQGLTRKEAATELGVSPETIKYNLEQSLRSIRAYCLSQVHIPIAILVALKLS
jgi:RNA polymerase sigma factor (sigma-70 family)